MEPVEDDERNADVRDDVPGQRAVVERVQHDRLGLLHLERVHNPQRQVAEEQEGDEGAPGLLGHVVLVLRAPAQPVKNEDGLDGGLEERECGCPERENREEPVLSQIRDRGHDEESVEGAETEQRDDQEPSVEGALL